VTDEQKRKRLRYLQLKAKAAAAEAEPDEPVSALPAETPQEGMGQIPPSPAEMAAAHFGLDKLPNDIRGFRGGLGSDTIPTPLEGIGKLISGAGGAAQGATFDWADELSAAKDTASVTALRALMGGGFQPNEILPTYRALRSSARGDLGAAHDLNPYTFNGSALGAAMAIPLPGGGASKAGGFGMRVLKGAGVGGGIGAMTGAGASRADLTKLIDGAPGEGIEQLEQFGSDVGISGGIGAGIGALGAVGSELLDRLRGRAQAGSDKALADQRAKEALAKEKATRSAAGTLGGHSAATLKTREELLKIVADTAESPEVRASAQKQLNDPRFAAAVSKARAEYIRKAPEQLAQLEADAAALEAAGNIDVNQAADQALAHPMRDQILPRLKTYAGRTLPVAVGTAMGGPGGAVVGGVVASTLGAPRTAFGKAMQSPSVRKLGWDTLLSLTGREAPNASRMASPASLLRLVERGGEETYPSDLIRKVAEQNARDDERRNSLASLLRYRGQQ
jgi:hypothetical protein